VVKVYQELICFSTCTADICMGRRLGGGFQSLRVFLLWYCCRYGFDAFVGVRPGTRARVNAIEALYLYWHGGGNTKVRLNKCVNMYICGPVLVGKLIRLVIPLGNLGSRTVSFPHASQVRSTKYEGMRCMNPLTHLTGYFWIMYFDRSSGEYFK
jgi:hypothetical protein